MTEHTHKPGTQGRVLEDVKGYVDHPDLPMVPNGIAGQLMSTRGMNVSVSKMYEDKGHKVHVVTALMEQGRVTTFPATSEQLFDSLRSFFDFCAANTVPPIIGLFAVWNGVSVARINQIERDKTDARSATISVCKDAIRSFLELAAMEGSVNVLIYFHQNKVYFGAVENQQVTVRIEDNTSEITEDEFQERVVMLQQGDDGVYR